MGDFGAFIKMKRNGLRGQKQGNASKGFCLEEGTIRRDIVTGGRNLSDEIVDMTVEEVPSDTSDGQTARRSEGDLLIIQPDHKSCLVTTLERG